MSKLYVLDDNLLHSAPEVRVGDKVYKVDDRQKTVKKLMKMVDKSASSDAIDEALQLTLGGEAFKEIDSMNLPFSAYQKLFELVMAAVTGEEPEVLAARFQKATAGK